jgi:hypothetical protein
MNFSTLVIPTPAPERASIKFATEKSELMTPLNRKKATLVRQRTGLSSLNSS